MVSLCGYVGSCVGQHIYEKINGVNNALTVIIITVASTVPHTYEANLVADKCQWNAIVCLSEVCICIAASHLGSYTFGERYLWSVICLFS